VRETYTTKSKVLLLLAAWLRELSFNASSRQFPDVDLWGRLSMGALISETGRFPYRDIFSYTAAGAPWIDHEWLSGLIFFQVFSLGGEWAFIALYALLLLSINGLIFSLHNCIYKVSPLWPFYSLLVTADVYSHGFLSTIRCQTFSFVLFCVFILILEGIRLKQWRKHWLLLLIPLATLWGNLHGGVAMGFILLGCYAFGSLFLPPTLGPSPAEGGGENLFTKRINWQNSVPYFGTALGMLGALSVCNPYGIKYLNFLWHAWTLNRSRIGEWSPVQLDSWYYHGLQILMVVALSVTILQIGHWKERKKVPDSFTPTLAVFIFCLMVWKAIRMEAFFAFTCIAYAPVIVQDLKPYLSRLSISIFSKNYFAKLDSGGRYTQLLVGMKAAFSKTIPAFILGGSLLTLIYLHFTLDLGRLVLNDELTKTDVTQFRYPVGIIDALKKSGYHGNLMTHFDVGEFAYWTLYPQFKVSLDGRYEEVYTQAQFFKNQYFYDKKDAFQAQEHARVLAEQPVDYLITEPKLPSTVIILNDARWKMLGGNDYFLVFANRTRIKNPAGLAELPMSLPLKIRSIRDYFPHRPWFKSK